MPGIHMILCCFQCCCCCCCCCCRGAVSCMIHTCHTYGCLQARVGCCCGGSRPATQPGSRCSTGPQRADCKVRGLDRASSTEAAACCSFVPVRTSCPQGVAGIAWNRTCHWPAARMCLQHHVSCTACSFDQHSSTAVLSCPKRCQRWADCAGAGMTIQGCGPLPVRCCKQCRRCTASIHSSRG